MLRPRLRAVALFAAGIVLLPAGPVGAEEPGAPGPLTGATSGEQPSDSPAEVVDEAPADPTPDADEPAAAPDADEPTATPDSGEPPAEPAEVVAPAAYVLAFLSPTDGAVVQPGTVPWSLRTSTPQTYTVELTCEESAWDRTTVSSTADGEVVGGTFGGLGEFDTCRLEAYADATGEVAAVDFTTGGPRPEVRDLSASPRTFYPYVRDDYRDRTRISFGTRLDSAVTVRIRNRDDRTVWSRSLAASEWESHYERRSISWNGRNAGGNLVPTGTYRILVTSTLGGVSTTSRTDATVARGTRLVTTTRRKDGWYGSVDATRGSCYASFYDPGNHLDCWGGRYARATYWFRLPSNAFDVSWRVRGYQTCCSSPGRITRTGIRPNARTFRVRVQVTGWRGYVVERASVTYSYRRAI